jgi:glycosyltransferase involved in cell wall biosynthesis
MLPPSATGRRAPGDFLLYPAATTPHKNHRLLVRYLVENPAAPPVVCVGPEVEPGFGELRELAAAHGISRRLQVRGMVPAAELDRLYDGCWAVVMPTLHEAASGPVMEAFCRGVPVLAADIPALRGQMAQCGADVSWFDPFSPASLAAAVDRMCASYDALTQAARRGGAWYAELSWPATAARYASVIDAGMARA